MSVYYEKARELAALLTKSDEFKEYEDSKQRFYGSESVQEKVKEFDIYNNKMREKLQSSTYSFEEIDSITEEIKNKHTILCSEEIIEDYLKKERSFKVLVDTSINIILSTISDPEDDLDGAFKEGHKCGGCGRKCI